MFNLIKLCSFWWLLLQEHQPLVEDEDEDYIVEAFWGHVKDKTHKFKLITKWVGWDPQHNTAEPIKEKAEECPTLLLEYLLDHKDCTTEVVQYIKNTKSGKFIHTSKWVSNYLKSLTPHHTYSFSSQVLLRSLKILLWTNFRCVFLLHLYVEMVLQLIIWMTVCLHCYR